MAKLITKKDKHLEEVKKIKRKDIKHIVKCVNCGSISEYMSSDRDKDDYITCLNSDCRHKLMTAWGNDEELIDTINK